MKKVSAFIKKHKKLTIFLVIILIIVGLVTYVKKKATEAVEMLASMTAGEVVEVEKRSLVDSLSATGKIASVDSQNVAAAVTGVEVLEILVEEGDYVKAGDIICYLDSENLEIQKGNTETAINAAKTSSNIDIASAQRALTEAGIVRDLQVERDFEDAQIAFDEFAKAVDERDKAQREFDTAKEMYDFRLNEYDNNSNANDAVNNNGGIAGSDAKAITETQFASKKEEFSRFLINHNIGVKSTDALGNTKVSVRTTSDIGIASEAVDYLKADEFAYITEDTSKQSLSEDDKNAIRGYIDALRHYRSMYTGGSYTDGTNYLSTTLNTAKADYDAKKQALDAKQQAVDAKLNAYRNLIRNYDDKVRGNANSVANSTDTVRKAQLNSTTSTLDSEYRIKTFNDQIAECTVVAPMDGVITSVGVTAGAVYQGSNIVTIQDESAYEVVTEIDEYDITKVKVGQRVVIKTNGTGDTEFDGEVIRIAPTATPAAAGTVASSVTYKVYMSIKGDVSALKLDMTAKLSIIIDEKDGVLTVPYDAVQTDDDGNFYVELGNESELSGAAPDSKKAVNMPVEREKLYITRGIESDFYIEIIGDGVKEGLPVYVPKKDSGNNFMQMMMEQGAMGGF